MHSVVQSSHAVFDSIVTVDLRRMLFFMSSDPITCLLPAVLARGTSGPISAGIGLGGTIARACFDSRFLSSIRIFDRISPARLPPGPSHLRLPLSYPPPSIIPRFRLLSSLRSRFPVGSPATARRRVRSQSAPSPPVSARLVFAFSPYGCRGDKPLQPGIRPGLVSLSLLGPPGLPRHGRVATSTGFTA